MLRSKFVKYQLVGVGFITTLLTFCTFALLVFEKLIPSYSESHVAVGGSSGDGRRGMFVLWIFFVFIFTVFNILFMIFRYLRRGN